MNTLLALSIENIRGVLCESYGIRNESIFSYIAQYGAIVLLVLFCVFAIGLFWVMVRLHYQQKQPSQPETVAMLARLQHVHTLLLKLSLTMLIGAGVFFSTWLIIRVPYFESERSLRDGGCANWDVQ